MTAFYPCELHCHTLHSDGHMQPEELLEEAHRLGLSLIALTDHNTTSALPFCGAQVIPGIELTTYYGHMTILGAQGTPDWREMRQEEPDSVLRKAHAMGGLCCIAHPYRTGSPICAGCTWEYVVKDPALIDMIEVWSLCDPVFQSDMPFAMRMWQTMLDCGNRVVPTYGRDWHEPGRGLRNAVTYLAIDGACTPQTALQALRNGRVALSMGPAPCLQVERLGKCYVPGDTLPPGRAVARIMLLAQNPVWDAHWQAYGIAFESVRILGEGGRILAQEPYGKGVMEIAFNLLPGPVRAEIWGTLDGRSCVLALTGALYCQYPTLICAHAGAEGTLLNSLDFINDVLSVGCEALEVDVQVDEESIYYLSHEPLPAYAPRTTLEQCFQLIAQFPRMRVNCDMKQEGLVEGVIRLADRYGLRSRLIFTGLCSISEDLAALARYAPNSGWLGFEHPPVDHSFERALDQGCFCVNASHDQVDSTMRAAFKRQGIRVSLWTLDDKAQIEEAISQQVYSITTNYPRLAMAVRSQIWEQLDAQAVELL